MWTFNPTKSRPDLFLQADKGTEVATEAGNECVNPGNIALLGPLVRLAKSLTRRRTRFTELQKLCEDLIVFMFRPCNI
jgi:hypothetical protein